MSVTYPSDSDALPQPTFPVQQFTVAQYRRMGQAGILTPEDRVELLEGWIVPKLIHNPPHDATVELVHEALRSRLSGPWRVRIQSPITTADSEPEPDVAVVRGSIRDHAQRHPAPDEIALVVEVADSSLARDRLKRRLYARAGIGEYWIVNPIDAQIEVSTDPTGPTAMPAFRGEYLYGPHDAVPLSIAGTEPTEIHVRELLP